MSCSDLTTWQGTRIVTLFPFVYLSRYMLYLLHSSLQSSDQKKVFKMPPPGVRKIVSQQVWCWRCNIPELGECHHYYSACWWSISLHCQISSSHSMLYRINRSLSYIARWHCHRIYYTLRFNEVERGVYWFHLVRLWTESCPLCIFNNTHRILFILAHLIKQLQKVCRMQCLFQNSKIWYG